MYPSTKFQIVDNSDIDQLTVPEDNGLDRPVFMQVFSADKGPEEWQNGIMGQDFYKLYGETPSFNKHGQPLCQAAAIINEGGRLLCKRVVDDEATLASVIVTAVVSKDYKPAEDADGNYVYTKTDGTTTTDKDDPDIDTSIITPGLEQYPGVVPKQVANVDLEYRDLASSNILTANGASTRAYLDGTVANAIESSLGHANTPAVAGADHDEFPLFVITDNGRGVSNKKIKILADTSAARPVDYIKYILYVNEGSTNLESMEFTFTDDVVELQRNLYLEQRIKSGSKQIRFKAFPSEIEAFVADVADIANIDIDEFRHADILNGLDLYGRSYDTIRMGYVKNVGDTTATPVNAFEALKSTNGVSLTGGDNGLFANAPMKSPTYATLVANAFSGISSAGDGDMIFDLDNTRVDVVFDADYPARVKRLIEGFVTFREDVFYFRDMGKNLESLRQIMNVDADNLKSRLCASYENSWNIIEPFSKKEVTVTCTYSLAQRFVKHFLDGRYRPFCGQLYSVTFPEVIEGTVNFIPKIVPDGTGILPDLGGDQKQIIDDARINYCGYYNGVLTMETDYTSQQRYTQLSWLHNVLLIQELIKAIRQRCPKIRYNFMEEEDLQKYQDDVQVVIDKFNTKFKSIKMEYVEDNIYKANKIFYAVLSVQLKDFIQAELFKITVLRNY